MAQGNGNRLARERRRQKFGRKSISASLVQALGLDDHHGSAKGARKLGCTPRTLSNHLHNRSASFLELVIDRPEYATPFARALLKACIKRERAEKKAA
jgi:hypothetical protein